ncbi:MAG: tRNA glutamyl-Q(34) synthetase GluQRS [Alphaproteobacteria bacterium]|nr:MAG: tRNA glutamyl-Q(34) synthetase GluQRS [Alphaproteobacteria bacterium]
MQPVLRFAPSPNGYLHLGHALSALIDFEMAQSLGGRYLLRIEDIDATRCRPEFEQAIYEDLAWLGIRWEEPVRRQSDNLDAYAQALGKLEAQGLVYPGFESRAEIARHIAQHTGAPWPHDPDGSPLYPGMSKQLSPDERASRIAAGEPYALRLDMSGALNRTGALTWVEIGTDPHQEHDTLMAQPEKWGDVVLARKDTSTSYHLSVVVDDALQGVTHVVRGQDLYQATSVHRVLQALLGLPPPLYHHHRLILDAEGHKLSKSTRATALRELRRQGRTPADIRRMIGLA